jgi:hypothetical protein
MENLGSDIHYRVVTHGELQLVVVEKNAGRAMLALGDSAYVVFSPEHCIVLSDDRESRMARERSPA